MWLEQFDSWVLAQQELGSQIDQLESGSVSFFEDEPVERPEMIGGCRDCCELCCKWSRMGFGLFSCCQQACGGPDPHGEVDPDSEWNPWK